MSNTTEESKLTEKLLSRIDELIKKGYPLYWEHRSGSGGFNYRKGVADLFLVVNGTHIEIELKAKKGKRSTAQEKFAYKCQLRNIPYICSNDLEELKSYIKKFLP